MVYDHNVGVVSLSWHSPRLIPLKVFTGASWSLGNTVGFFLKVLMAFQKAIDAAVKYHWSIIWRPSICECEGSNQ
jgi:hypothetical protein